MANLDNNNEVKTANVIPWLALGWIGLFVIAVILILAFCVGNAKAQTQLPPLSEGCTSGWYIIWEFDNHRYCDEFDDNNYGDYTVYFCMGPKYSYFNEKWYTTLIDYTSTCEYSTETIELDVYITHLPLVQWTVKPIIGDPIRP